VLRAGFLVGLLNVFQETIRKGTAVSYWLLDLPERGTATGTILTSSYRELSMLEQGWCCFYTQAKGERKYQ
jgi:hypothetical protein